MKGQFVTIDDFQMQMSQITAYQQEYTTLKETFEKTKLVTPMGSVWVFDTLELLSVGDYVSSKGDFAFKLCYREVETDSQSCAIELLEMVKELGYCSEALGHGSPISLTIRKRVNNE